VQKATRTQLKLKLKDITVNAINFAKPKQNKAIQICEEHKSLECSMMLGTYDNACIVTSTYAKVKNKPMAFN
jgi:hypothetical protein